MNLSRQHIRRRLKDKKVHKSTARLLLSRKMIDPQEVEPAAVLLPIYQHEDDWHLIFIKRTEHDHDDHSGQIAFPGGRVEAGDETLLDTALREAEEEIGLKREDVEILGYSRDIVTVTHFRITPIVGQLPWPYALDPSSTEVKKILTMPLSWLGDPDNYRMEMWTPDQGKYEPHPIIFYEPYQDEILWGATAKMVRDFIDLLALSP